MALMPGDKNRVPHWPRSIAHVLRRILKRLVYFPVSPLMFKGLVRVMRAAKMLPAAEKATSHGSRNVLICHPYSRVGDLVLLLPFVQALKEYLPNGQIDVVVGAPVADLLMGIDGLGRILKYQPPQVRGRLQNRYARIVGITQFYRKQVGLCRYDLAIAPRWGSVETYDAHYLAYLTGAPVRCGYSARVDGGDTELDSFLTIAATGGTLEHESLRNLHLLVRSGIIDSADFHRFPIDQPLQPLTGLIHRAELRESLKRAQQLVMEHTPYGIVSPGATKPFCIWPKENMIELIEGMSLETGLHFYVVGAATDAELCKEIERALPGCATSLGGKTTLPELIHILSRAALFVGNDSGTAHIAGGLGIPTFVIHPFPASYHGEHPNSPVRFRPCGPKVRILQPLEPIPPCEPTCSAPHPHCIRQIKVSDVLGPVRDVVNTCRTPIE